MLSTNIVSRARTLTCAALAWVSAAAAQADLLVLDTGGSGHGPGYVWRFDERSGRPALGLGVTNEGLSALAVAEKKSGGVFVTAIVLGEYTVHHFDAAGEKIGPVAVAWAGQMRGVTAGEGGTLHAIAFDDARQAWALAKIHDGKLEFLTPTYGTMSAPVTMRRDAKGDWLVLDRARGLLRFDGATGVSLGIVVPLGAGGLNDPSALAVGSDGFAYVADAATNQVLRFDARTGGFRGAAVSSGAGGLANPQGLAFGPSGELFVTSRDTRQVLRFDASTGAFRGVAADLPHVRHAGAIAFTPNGPLPSMRRLAGVPR